MKPGLSTLRDNVGNVLAGVSQLAQKRVLVGIPEEKAGRSDEGASKGPINNAALGYIHENGAPEVNIPPRPWLEPGVQEAAPQYEKYLKQAGEAALEGNIGRMDRAFNAAGMTAASAAKNKINTGPFVPLKPGTLAARLRRGRTGTRPLIDTGQLRNAITYIVTLGGRRVR